ncbi:MAG: peptidase S41 [Phycisphaeraceae bacterium]|nr:peptidase S41 [Phycisphaeraceae bacterium]
MAPTGFGQDWAESRVKVVLEAHALVAEHFYDTDKLEEVGWEEMANPTERHAFDELDQILYFVYSNAGFAGHIDIRRALDKLGASHTEHFHQGQREYYDLLDVFREAPALQDDMKRLFPPDGRVQCGSIGLRYQQFQELGLIVTDVIPGSAADEGHYNPGDRISYYAGEHGERPLQLQLNEGHCDLSVTPHPDGFRAIWRVDQVNPTQEYLDYMTNSASVVERDGVRLGYVRIYSWAGQHYQDRLEELLQQEPLASADGVILDIRGGWGGANPQYLDLFGAPMPTLTQIPREGEAFTWDPAEDLPERTFRWRKPVALLVDGGTRSGKEIIAYAFRKHGIGPVVGTKTAGAVLAGRPFILSDGSLLYLAVADVLVDGERLEGVGVEPDVVVERDLPFCNGKDPQLDAAYDALLAEIQGKSKR